MIKNPRNAKILLWFAIFLACWQIKCTGNKQNDDKVTTPTVPTYYLNVIVSPPNSGATNTQQGAYTQGQVVSLAATGNSDWRFESWYINGVIYEDNPISITMDANKSVVAIFSVSKYDVTTDVTPEGAGTVTPSPGKINFGETVTVEATANPGWQFYCWSVNGVAYEQNPLSITVDSGKVAVAYFLPAIFNLTTTIAPTEAGTISPSSGLYYSGQTVSLTATVNPNWNFDHWEINGIQYYENPITITMDSDKTVVAYFVPVKFNLTTAVAPTEAGTISPSSGQYNSEQTISITATANPNWNFDHWEINGIQYNQNPISVTMDSDKTVTAYFVLIKYNLTTVVSPSGAGTISPPSGQYNSGQTVSLTATVNPNWDFDHWEINGIQYNQNPISVTMDSDKTVVAYFVPVKFNLTTAVSPTEAGTISPSSGQYNSGQTISITASANPNWNFDHWEINGIQYNQNPISVTMDSDKTVTAYFVSIKYNLTTVVSPSGAGTISPPSGQYNSGQAVSLTATANPNWDFDHWEINGIQYNQNPISVTMDSNKTVTAYFVSVKYNLTTVISPSGAGTVTPSSGQYTPGQIVTLTATANSNWQFDYSRGTDNDYQNPIVVTMDGNKTVTIYFIPKVNQKINGINFSPFTTTQGVIPITYTDLQHWMEKVRPYTNWIRTFTCTRGMENAGVLAHKMGLKIAAGAYLSSDLANNQLEINSLIAMGQRGEIDMAIVGNEVFPNILSATQVIAYIRQVQQALPNIPVSYSETYDILIQYPQVVAECDLVLCNIYPYWQGIIIDHAVNQMREVYYQMITLFNKPVIIMETGWPDAGETINQAVASSINADYFFLNFISWVKAEDIDYFYFEALNEPWKIPLEGIKGGNWGLMTEDGTLKIGRQPVFDGQTMADNWSGAVVVNGPGTPDLYFTYVPPKGSTNLLTGGVNHVAPVAYRVIVFINPWGWYNKPTWDEPKTYIYPDGKWSCDITTGPGDENASSIAAFLVPANYVVPKLDHASSIPQDVYNNALDYIIISR